MFPYTYFNDSIVELSEAKLHISDLGIQRGYAIFDYFAVKGGKIQWKDDYFERFYNSANLADLDVPLDKTQLESVIKELVERNQSPDSYIKVLLTGGHADDSFNYDSSKLSILNYERQPRDMSLYENGVNLISAYYQRSIPEIKTTDYFMSASLHRKRKEFNAVDVLYYMDGIVTEASRANFYIIRDDEIFTTETDVLPGVTRKNFINKIDKHYLVNQQNVYLEDVWDADGAFISSTTKGVMPVVNIDGTAIGGGKVGDVMQDIMSIFNPLT